MAVAVDRAELLALYPALAGLPAARLDALLATGVTACLPAGSEVFTERQPCTGFPLLVAGSIKVVKQAANGRELVLYRVAPGGSCIITSSCLLGHADYNARGIAEAPLTLFVLPVSAFAALLVEHPPFRDFVFRLFSERIAELMQLVEEVAFARLDQRLARLLLARGEGDDQRHPPATGRRTGQRSRNRQPAAQGLRRAGTGVARPRADRRQRSRRAEEHRRCVTQVTDRPCGLA